MNRDNDSIFLLILVTATLLPNSFAHARKIEEWSYERLFSEADLIVIARVGRSKDTRDQFPEAAWGTDAFIGVNTSFTILQTLKNDIEGEKFTLLHFRAARLLSNGPLLLKFQTSPRRITGVERLDESGEKPISSVNIVEPPPNYLLFLRKRDDGRFEALSGQVDAALAVREIRSLALPW